MLSYCFIEIFCEIVIKRGETPSLAMPLAAVRRKLDESRPLFAFAGIWRLWTGERKGETGEHSLFAFLTTQSNEIVRPIHAKAMPVILTKPDEFGLMVPSTMPSPCKGRCRKTAFSLLQPSAGCC